MKLSSLLTYAFASMYNDEVIKRQIYSLSNTAMEITPEQFFSIRNTNGGKVGGKQISKYYDFTGVYIIYNQTKNKYYVGQAKNVFQRVNSHFTGHGNGDVYADYVYGNRFTIKMISLNRSGYSNLDQLERDTIIAYNAYSCGYNRNRGNGY